MQHRLLPWFSVLFTLWFSTTILPCIAQNKLPVISSPEHLRRLNEYKSKADNYCAKNLNRFGLDELQKYDRALDSLVAMEKADTLASIQKIYLLYTSRSV